VNEFKSALAIVRRAIHNEITGQRFYNDAAYYCIDPWAKEIFSTLAQEEQVHTRLLLLESESLTEHGRWLDFETASASDAKVDITRFEFPDDEPGQELFPLEQPVEGAVNRMADDLAALAFGIQMETEAIELYSQAGAMAGDPAARQAYQFLVEEETRHYNELKDQWEKLAGKTFEENRKE
jgi:rubrerythrin